MAQAKETSHTVLEETPSEDEPPPNGGWEAWLQVSAAFALYWNSLGLLNGFGAFQSYYETELLHSYSPSAISWIGTVQIFLLMAGGVVFGPLYDLGYARALLAAGTVLVTLGFAMTSLSTRYYQVLLAQGFCAGIGTSCLYIPAVTLVPAYFSTGPGGRRALAMGVASVGSSLGASVYPLILAQMQPHVGFGWAVRVIAFLALGMCSYATVVARPRQGRPRRTGPTGPTGETGQTGQITEPQPERTLKKRLARLMVAADLLDSRYLVQSLAVFFSNLGFFEPIYYLQSYAEANGMANDRQLARYLLVILNAVAIPGRLLPSYLADRRFGVLPTYIAICGLTAASCFYWISVTNRAGNLAFSVLYGFFSGSVVTLAPVVLASITDDLAYLGTRLGCVAVLKGISSLVGPPLAGALLSNEHGKYLGVQLFSAVSMLLTAVFAGGVQAIVVRRQRKKGQNAS